jgi:hypothetical protein
MALVAELVDAASEVSTVNYYEKKTIKLKNTNNSKKWEEK